MPRKLTLSEVKQTIIKKGFEPLLKDEDYINSQTKIKVRCKCGKIFYVKYNSIKTNRTTSCGHCDNPRVGDKFGKLTVIEVFSHKSRGCSVSCKCECGRLWGPKKFYSLQHSRSQACGHCRDPEVGDKFNKFTVIQVFPDKRGGCQVELKCDCGNKYGPITFNYIRSNHIKSCGKCNVPEIGKKFNKLTIISIMPNKDYGYDIKSKCDCGNICGPHKPSAVIQGHIKSCGHCRDPKVGDKFGQLTIIKILPSNHTSCSVLCKCQCGKICKPYRANLIIRGKIVSCGDCKLRRNGRFTSNIALELHNIIEKILDKKCEHNYFIDEKCFDIVCPTLKIAIEYDGYYWHRVYRNTTKKEKLDEKIAKKAGYKFLRIRSSGRDLPTEDQLKKVFFNHFSHRYKKWTITMSSWKELNNENLSDILRENGFEK